MRNPQWAIDLHTFPRDAKDRFVDSVTYGKRNMPPWEDVLKPDDLDALWAYVSTGDPVEIGDTMVVLESMKMEIPILSEAKGVVREIAVAKGDSVMEGDVLVVIDT